MGRFARHLAHQVAALYNPGSPNRSFLRVFEILSTFIQVRRPEQQNVQGSGQMLAQRAYMLRMDVRRWVGSTFARANVRYVRRHFKWLRLDGETVLKEYCRR